MKTLVILRFSWAKPSGDGKTLLVVETDRDQATLFPEDLENSVCEHNPVRATHVFVDELDVTALGFARVIPVATGRPSYHPAVLLKLYLYGYLNWVRSSRGLGHERTSKTHPSNPMRFLTAA